MEDNITHIIRMRGKTVVEDNITHTIRKPEEQDKIFLYLNGSWRVITRMLAHRSAEALSTVRLKSSSTAVTSDNILLLLIAASLVYLTCSPSL